MDIVWVEISQTFSNYLHNFIWFLFVRYSIDSMESFWVKTAISTIHAISFVCDVITFPVYLVLQKPWRRRELSRRVKVSYRSICLCLFLCVMCFSRCPSMNTDCDCPTPYFDLRPSAAHRELVRLCNNCAWCTTIINIWSPRARPASCSYIQLQFDMIATNRFRSPTTTCSFSCSVQCSFVSLVVSVFSMLGFFLSSIRIAGRSIIGSRYAWQKEKCALKNSKSSGLKISAIIRYRDIEPGSTDNSQNQMCTPVSQSHSRTLSLSFSTTVRLYLSEHNFFFE